jgi:hypothetical protein
MELFKVKEWSEVDVLIFSLCRESPRLNISSVSIESEYIGDFREGEGKVSHLKQQHSVFEAKDST